MNDMVKMLKHENRYIERKYSFWFKAFLQDFGTEHRTEHSNGCFNFFDRTAASSAHLRPFCQRIFPLFGHEMCLNMLIILIVNRFNALDSHFSSHFLVKQTYPVELGDFGACSFV